MNINMMQALFRCYLPRRSTRGQRGCRTMLLAPPCYCTNPSGFLPIQGKWASCCTSAGSQHDLEPWSYRVLDHTENLHEYSTLPAAYVCPGHMQSQRELHNDRGAPIHFWGGMVFGLALIDLASSLCNLHCSCAKLLWYLLAYAPVNAGRIVYVE